jgi:hypothetical protein
MLGPALLDRATRDQAGDVPRERGVAYYAAMDPGFSRNAWTLCVAGARWIAGSVKRSVVLLREWRGTSERPLDPRVVLPEIAALCIAYGVDRVESDGYEKFSLRSIAEPLGLHVAVPPGSHMENLAMYEALQTQFFMGAVDIPPDPQLRADLLGIHQRLTPNGFSIDLASTPDGRHSDYAPSVARALSKCKVDPDVVVGELTPEERALAEQKTIEDALFAEVAARKKPRFGKLPGNVVVDEPTWMRLDKSIFRR